MGMPMAIVEVINSMRATNAGRLRFQVLEPASSRSRSLKQLNLQCLEKTTQTTLDGFSPRAERPMAVA